MNDSRPVVDLAPGTVSPLVPAAHAGGSPSAVDRAAWPWRDAPARVAAATASEIRGVRRMGMLQGIVGAVAAAVLFWGFERPGFAAVVASIALISVSLALASPLRGYRVLLRGVEALGRGLGAVVRWTLLPLVWMVLFVPVGWARRLRGKSWITRRPDPGLATYWKPSAPDPAKETYGRQF